MEKVVGVSNQKLSWVLTTDLDSHRQLFYGLKNTHYEVDTYCCSCGYNKFIIKKADQKLGYDCEECNNSRFLDANHADLSIAHFLTSNYELINDLKLSIEIELAEDKLTTLLNRLEASLTIEIPSNIDFISEQIVYTKKKLYSVSFGMLNKFKYEYLIKHDQEKFDFIIEKIEQLLTKTPERFNIPHSNIIDKYTINHARFFLTYPHFKEFDFFYWNEVENFHEENVTIADVLNHLINHRQEKSVKKALYQNYIQQIKNKKFHYGFLRFISQEIIDPNLLVKVIATDLSKFKFSEIDLGNVKLMIGFLKIHYAEKQIVTMLESVPEESIETFFLDTSNSFIYAQEILQEEFAKVPCSLNDLHDEFVRCSNIFKNSEIIRVIFEYEELEKSKCRSGLDYDVRLPQSGKELLCWADDLHNCLATYYKQIKAKQTTIYGFFKDDQIQFATEVDIKNKQILQSARKYNRELTVDEQKALHQWFEIVIQGSINLTV